MTGRDMPKNRNSKATVKKTVVLHQIIDEYVRKTWAMLIAQGHDASYSTALNFMLLAEVVEGARKGGFSEGTLEALHGFLGDSTVLQRLDLRKGLDNLSEFWGVAVGHQD